MQTSSQSRAAAIDSTYRALRQRVTEERLSRPRTRTIVAGLCAVSLTFAYLTGPQHDYVTHLQIWQSVIAAQNPWISATGELTGNAYGPLFVAIGYLVRIHPLAPKLLYVLCWFACIFWMIAKTEAHHRDRPRSLAGILVFCLAPFFVIDVFYFGHFDILVAILTLAAIHCADTQRPLAAGLSLGSAILLKFMPVFLLPVLALSGRRPQWRLITATIATVVVGFGWAVTQWGSTVFVPVFYAIERGAKLNSIFYFLEGAYSPLHRLGWAYRMVSLSVPLLLLANAAVYVRFWCGRLGLWSACLLTTLATLLFYRVGHPQFFCSFFVILHYWTLRAGDSGLVKPVRTMGHVLMAWFSVLLLLYVATGGFYTQPFQFIRETCGLVTFVLGVMLAVRLARVGPDPDETARLATSPAAI